MGGACVSVSCDALCGDGKIEGYCCEQCDDGTRLDGDGCSATCTQQPDCVPQPTRCELDVAIPCDDDDDCARALVGGWCRSFMCNALCGDGIRESFCCETCDDGRSCQTE